MHWQRLVLSEPLPLFFIIQFQWLEQSVVSSLPVRQKAPLRQGFQRPPVLSKPLPLFL
ncbi:hypothetical protein BK730_01110 [Bacillus wiedmannii]|uniref:Uncharacterized protein n=1 Tax=Bacillus wiedmannii TaxID=1890302 RepID=A0A2C9YM04_9BACI|nr:hypothetical protein BK730_01110 [Bacillus wiedmannii]